MRRWRRRRRLVLAVAFAHVPLPVGDDENRVYDSGTAQPYRLRPRTQFQQ